MLSPTPSDRQARPLRVAIVNDYEIVVRGMAAVLKPFAEQVEVVELDARRPVAGDVDVILYDTFSLAQADAVDLAGLGGGPDTRVVVFSWNIDPQLVVRSLDAGAHGYVSKGTSAEELVAAIQKVSEGQQVTPPLDEGTDTGRPAGTSRLDDTFGKWPGHDAGLSPREAEVLALICQGLTNQDIIERAYITINTLKTHIRSLYRKIDVTTRSQAVRWGLERGFGPDRLRLVRDQQDAG